MVVMVVAVSRLLQKKKKKSRFRVVVVVVFVAVVAVAVAVAVVTMTMMMTTTTTILDKHGIDLFLLLLRITMAHKEPHTDVVRALAFALDRALFVAVAVGVAIISSLFRSSSPRLRR